MILAIACAVLLSRIVGIGEASECYPIYCQERTLIKNDTNTGCLIESIKTNDECINLSFDHVEHYPPTGEEPVQIRLAAYVKNDDLLSKRTAFNVSVTDFRIRKIIMRYQSTDNKKLSECHQVELFNNSTDIQIHPTLFISCALSNGTFETLSYRLDYLITTDKYEYSRQLVFIVSKHESIDADNVDVKSYIPFIYVDPDATELSLYIQPVPLKYKVTSYRIWLFNNETDLISNITETAFGDQQLRYTFLVESGLYYFKVASLHPNCDEYGCVNSTSPLISIKNVSHRLLIMIISVIWIPPVIFYAIFNAYKLYRKNEKLKRAERRLTCLMVYQPTHTLHVNVMLDLARYLRGCNVHAIIDVLDLPGNSDKDPAIWYNEMISAADIILWAASPASNGLFVPAYMESVENQILRLAKDNQTRRSKKLYVLQFPYCTITDLPPEAQSLKQFCLPGDLEKLVKTINNVDYVRFFGVSSKLFVDSIIMATAQLRRNSSNISEGNDMPLLIGKSSRKEMGESTTSPVDECDGDLGPTKQTAERNKLLHAN